MASKDNMVFTTPEAARAEVEYLVRVGSEKRAAEEAVQVLQIDGHTYTAFRGSLSRVKPVPEEAPDVFKAFSLSGLVDFIKTDVDGIFKDPSVRHTVHVIDPKHVEVISPMRGFYKSRDVVAKCEALTPRINFGTFMGVEEFQIMVQAMFAETVNRALVLQLSGSLRKEQSTQTADDGVAAYCNRGYPTAVYQAAVARLKKAGIPVITHIIIGLPGDDPVVSTRYAVDCGTDGVKFHLLHILKNTRLAEQYDAGRGEVLTIEKYARILKDCISVLPREVVVHRITGDGAKRDLVAPLWSADKKRVLNYLNRTLTHKS